MRFRLPALALAVVTLAACGGKDETAAPPPTTTAPAAGAPAAEAEPLLAVSSDAEGSRLSWVDGMTLEPAGGGSVALPFAGVVGELSPDGSSLAVGANEGGGIGLVDLDAMRLLGTIETGGSFVQTMHWARPDLLLAALGGLPSRAVAIDPRTAEVLATRDLGGTVLYAEEAENELVFLVAPANRIGPARVVVFDGGELRSAKLAEVRAGWEQVGESQEDYRARQSIPGLAVDPSGTRALVVPVGGRVAEVDLETMRVRYHDLAEPVSLFGRLLDWLQSAAHAKAMDGPDRNAVWLPSGLVAVSGSQYVSDGDGNVDMTPAGLALIDPGDWSVRRLSDQPTWATLRDGALLASGWTAGTDEQTLIVFDPDGTLRFSLAREGTDLSQTHGGYLYATTNDGTRYEMIDLETGETVAEAQPKRETFLLYLD